MVAAARRGPVLALVAVPGVVLPLLLALLAPPPADARLVRRTVTLVVAGTAEAGAPLRFSGRVTGTPRRTVVRIQRRLATASGGSAWSTVATARTGPAGRFAKTVTAPAEGRATFRALVPRTRQRGALYPARSSGPRTVTVGPRMREVMVVGNNWDGTASLVDAHTHRVLRKGIDLVPDLAEELRDIHASPARTALYYLVRYGPGEGNDQLVDDMFTTNDGRLLAVSRPSLGDVVWIDLARALAGRRDSIVAEQQVDGYRTDHMGVSPDRTRLLVSDSTSRQVIEYVMGGLGDPSTGRRLRTFESGETPHESNYSADGSRIFHASIGRVYLPGDEKEIPLSDLSSADLNPLGLPLGLIPGTDLLPPVKLGPLHDAIKGDRWFEIVSNRTFQVLQRWEMGKEMEEAGYPGQSSAVRPMAIAPGERFVYFQLSYLHGIVEFDTQAPDLDGRVSYTLGGMPEPRVGRVTRVIPLEKRTTALREQYVNDSAHHGLAIDESGRTLCAAGTMDDYVAMVDRASGRYVTLDEATTGHYYGKPYWTTDGPGDTCWASLSDADAVAVVDFRTNRELAYLDVGNHPQRIRYGTIPEKLL